MANQRLLPIKNGYNFRDLGGYPTADGHQIKWHRLIRTGSLARLDQNDLTVLDNIPISLDIDLRAPQFELRGLQFGSADHHRRMCQRRCGPDCFDLAPHSGMELPEAAV